MEYQSGVQQFIKVLKNLEAILDKGAAFADHKQFEMGNLLTARLAPDQFNLIRQVQIACDSAKLCVTRLTGKTAPVHEDKEATLPQLKSRIEETIAFLNSVKDKDFEGADAAKVTNPRWENKHLVGKDYFWQHAIPNFYFHVTVAYEILRHNGVEIGKKDYLGPMPFRD